MNPQSFSFTGAVRAALTSLRMNTAIAATMLTLSGFGQRAAVAENPILVQTADPLLATDARPIDVPLSYRSIGHLAEVRVGSTAAPISGIGIYAEVHAPCDIS